MTDERGDGYLIEDLDDGRALIVTGRWSRAASAAVERPDVDGVWLNYARGYSEPDLSFVRAWPIKRLLLLDRSVTDLTPLARLAETLQDLSLDVAPGITIDLAALPQLRALSASWDAIKDTLYAPQYLSELLALDYDEADLDALTVQPSLQRIQLKLAPNLETLNGAQHLPTLTLLKIVEARQLHGIDVLQAAAPTLRELTFEDCPRLGDLDIVGTLGELRFLGIEDCGMISSLKPLAALSHLEAFYAWGSTCVEDADLSPLLHLAALKDVRMAARRQYMPSLEAVKERLACA